MVFLNSEAERWLLCLRLPEETTIDFTPTYNSLATSRTTWAVLSFPNSNMAERVAHDGEQKRTWSKQRGNLGRGRNSRFLRPFLRARAIRRFKRWGPHPVLSYEKSGHYGLFFRATAESGRISYTVPIGNLLFFLFFGG